MPRAYAACAAWGPASLYSRAQLSVRAFLAARSLVSRFDLARRTVSLSTVSRFFGLDSAVAKSKGRSGLRSVAPRVAETLPVLLFARNDGMFGVSPAYSGRKPAGRKVEARFV